MGDGMTTEKRERVVYFSWLRAIACIAVVILHVFSMSAGALSEDTEAWGRAFMLTGKVICQWAIPVFVMVSGALLLDPEREFGFSKVKKYVLRMVYALVVLTILYQVIYSLLPDGDGARHPEYLLPWKWFENFYTGSSFSHLWYLYMMAGMYLMTPVFKTFLRAATDKELRYLLILLGIFQIVSPTVYAVTGFSAAFYIPVYTAYPFYFFAGHALHGSKAAISFRTAAVLAITGTAVVVIGTFFGVRYDIAWLKGTGANFASLFVAMQAVGIFRMMMEKKNEANVVLVTDKRSFAVYLFHMPILVLLYRLIGPGEGFAEVMVRAVIYGVVSFAVSFIIGMGLKKLPWFEKWV